ncbi:oligopeptide ABC transporter permease OppB [Rhizobium sp. CC-YZS058]|uniref:oligopeptide ABC transporter permease OppB n=1 Tax=Rhizobium sp. CC-YZS058 TaxID=3042153 RepID=UPI002B05C10C|nr:oligopeptide ABC transporter permease OppB [Rhizobium sp. CC-YZS058]MEA3533455.1 oligopeptide ABC transporter permease OppB [Rhizobium sp. CC-YZS058]
MISFILRRLMSAVPTLFIVVTLSFFLMRFAPGSPFNLRRPLPPQITDNLNRTFGLDLPIWQQYLRYLANLATGNLGPSYVYRDNSVNELIAMGLPYSIKLGLLTLVIALVGGVLAGAYAGLKQNSAVDFLIMAVSAFGITVPNFVVGPLLTLLFAVMLGWLPAGGWGDGSIRYLALPMVTLALPQLAIFARMMRGSMIEALNAEHIRTARAYGLPAHKVVVVHAMRAALLPIVSYLAPCAAGLLTGSAVIESIYTIPGVGRYFVSASINRDYTLVMATVVLIAVFVIVFNLIVDLLYALIDPRVRHD